MPPPISIAPREWAVAIAASLTLVFTAWGFGGVIAWSLHTLLVGGLLTFFLAICPMPAKWNGKDGQHGNLANSKRLLKAPIFWIGLVFLLYLVTGGLNPSLRLIGSERGWWVVEMTPPLGDWLPSSVASPYEPMNAWRIVNLHLAALSLSLGIWIGISRRLTVQLVLWSFILSGSCMAFVAILQHVAGAGRVLWTLESSNSDFWGSFFYRNQATAYLNLTFFISGAAYFYYSRKAHEHAASGGPHFLILLLLGLLASSVALALSRGGILFGTVLVTAFIALALLQKVAQVRTLRRSVLVSLLSIIVLGLGIFSLLRQVDIEAIQERFGDVNASISEFDQSKRSLARRAVVDMIEPRMAYGWGAGAFRYVFPSYQQNYPEIYYSPNMYKGKPKRLFWRYAHCDLLQYVAEYGILGSVLLLLFFCALVVQAGVGAHGGGLPFLFALIGVFAAMGHAFFDFIFHSPSYWVGLLGALTVLLRLLFLEGQRISAAT